MSRRGSWEATIPSQKGENPTIAQSDAPERTALYREQLLDKPIVSCLTVRAVTEHRQNNTSELEQLPAFFTINRLTI